MSRKKKNKWILNNEFRLIDGRDKRAEQYRKYKKRHGFSPDELWNLDMTIVEFTLPRLKEFAKMTGGYPVEFTDRNDWYTILGKMIKAFELYSEDRFTYNTDEREKIKEGLDLFREYFSALWW